MKGQIRRRDVVFSFLKRYGYIILLSLLALAFAVVLAVTANTGNNNNDGDVDGGKTEFYPPVLSASVIKGFSDSKLQWNETLKQWETHKAVDFKVADNADVFAVLDGTVENVYSNYLEGTVVVIKHSNNIKTVYGSLQESVKVKKGDTVKKGALIGKAGNTAKAEASAGTILHFSVLENDVKIDPITYLDLESVK